MPVLKSSGKCVCIYSVSRFVLLRIKCGLLHKDFSYRIIAVAKKTQIFL